MKYNEITKEHLIAYLEKIDEKLRSIRGLQLENFRDFRTFLKDNTGRIELVGDLKIIFSLEYRRKDGTRICHFEKLSFSPRGFNLINHYSEDFFGERYSNNESRFGFKDLPDEFFTKYLEDSINNIYIILERVDSIIEVDANRFGTKTRRANSLLN